MLVRTVSCQQERHRLQMATGRITLGQGPTQLTAGLMPVSLWRLQMDPDRNRHLLCTKLCLYDGRSNVQGTIKGREQKILHQFGLLSHIFSQQGAHFTAYKA